MITAIFNPGDKSITTEKLLQWDYGQVLSIKGLDLPKAVEIHFCVYTDSTTITAVGITTDDHTDVEIPDGLLQQERELRAYVYVADLEQGKTVRTVNIPIQSRQKPEIPHTPEDTEIFREAIKAVNDSADRAETAANTSEQNAKKTAEDRAAIAEMVETVSGIEQQVQDVKKYAGQAETAASNAALSEREAKEAKTAALQAKADAETAKGSAETAAGQTAEDRTAVESVKEEVLQAKQQVSTDRAAVEAVERKVAQMGNAIPQAVLEGVQAVGSAGAAEKHGIVQAGTEQKSAVESAGTKTIEDINLAKKTATDAVETAKTDAVGAVETKGTEQTRNVTAEGGKQVKAVVDKGNEVLQSIPEDFTVQMQSKLDKNQGVENKGKALVVGDDGNVVVGEVQSSGNADIIKALQDALISQVVNGESINVSDSSRLPVEEFSMSGKTVQNGTPTPTNPVDIEVTPQGIITVDFTDGTNHQIVELSCPREFTKWDRLEKIDGTWNWIFQSNKKIINEKTGFNTNAPQQQEKDGIVFTTSFPDASGGNQTSLCDKFKNLNYVYGGSYKEKYGYYCDHVSVEQKYFRPPNETIQTLEQWKTWLTENPIEILYKTKEPELIPLSPSEQDKLNAITMYAPNTEITNTGGCNMELTYTVDTKSYVDAKILTLSKALL